MCIERGFSSKLLIRLATVTLTGIHADVSFDSSIWNGVETTRQLNRAKVSVDEALEHESKIQFYNDTSQKRYPSQMDDYDLALHLLTDVTPIVSTNSSLRNFRSNVCFPNEATCSSKDNCCQGGCSTSGLCVCQVHNEWCFNYGQTDPFCCSNMCGVNGRCECIPKGKSCAVGDYCCDGLVCDGVSSLCTDETPQPTREPTLAPSFEKSPAHTPTDDESSGSLVSGCVDGESKISIEIQTDMYGGDTAWFLADAAGNPLINVPNGTYSLLSYDKVDLCVQTGEYNFTITDTYGDGICCAYGRGYVKISIDDREVLHFQSFGRVVSEILNVGFDPLPYMSKRHKRYLIEHNKRREMWHLSNNVSHVPLAWSPQLAEQSRVYAVKLLDACNTHGILHEPGVEFGENLAKNKGRNGWAQLYPVSKIVGRWVEWEINRTYPTNGHLTQALWRGSKYIGCGESSKSHKGGKCRVQVCRYARAGNCDMKRYNATYGENWLPPMLADTSNCGPHCPPEGCF